MAQKVGADKLMAAGCPADLAAVLGDSEKVGRLFDGHIIALFGKFAAIWQKDGPLFMQLIGPLSLAVSTGDWSGVIALAMSGTLGSNVWTIIQDILSILPSPPVVPAPPAA